MIHDDPCALDSRVDNITGSARGRFAELEAEK